MKAKLEKDVEVASSSTSQQHLRFLTYLTRFPTLYFQTEHVRIIYQCTWPKCGIKMDTCSDMERHVRSKHLK